MDNLPTFRLEQDPPEAFFSRVRSKLGSNTNPTVEQFKSAYRKILINKEITSSEHANCLDRLNIYFMPSTSKKNEDREELPVELPEECNDPFKTDDYLLDATHEATVCQIAAGIEFKIRTEARFGCNLCLNLFNENSKVVAKFLHNSHLDPPCVSTVHICKVASIYLNIFMKAPKFHYSSLLKKVLEEIDHGNVFNASDFQLHLDHKMHFIQYIAEDFIRVRATYVAKNLTLQEQEKMMRNKLNKTIHMVGQ